METRNISNASSFRPGSRKIYHILPIYCTNFWSSSLIVMIRSAEATTGSRAYGINVDFELYGLRGIPLAHDPMEGRLSR